MGSGLFYVRGDPRPSLEKRYASHAAYVKKVEAAVQQLMKERLLLAEDAERYVKAAQDLHSQELSNV